MSSDNQFPSVMVIDDDATFVAWVGRWLASKESVRFIGSGLCIAEARDEVARLRPDVLLLDFKIPGEGVLAYIRELQTTCPTTRVVVHTGALHREVLQSSLTAGAAGVLGKDVSPGELLLCVERAGKGHMVFSDSARRIILDIGR
jgi:DNA-binding NarL/FixJ family response regulator